MTIAKNTPIAEVVANEQLDSEACHKDLGGTQEIMAETKERNDVLLSTCHQFQKRRPAPRNS